MVPAASMTTGTAPGVLVADVSFRPTSPEEGRFTRADLVFLGVDHSETSTTRPRTRPRPGRPSTATPDGSWASATAAASETKAIARSPASLGPAPTFALPTR